MKFSTGSELVRFHGCESPTAWEGLYQNYDDWKRIVCRESYSHPAKMSPVLCEKIFEHLEVLQLIDHETSTVVDFMSGTATTNIIAGIRGYRSVSVELEPRFVRMQMKNREGLAAYTGREPEWRIMQGDARNLSKMFNGEVGRAGVTSPPYYGAEIDGGEDWFKVHHPKDGSRPPGMANTVTARYSKGNIAKLPGKLAITSPPYGQGLTRMKDNKLTGKIAAYFTPELLRKSGYETSNLKSKGQIQNLPVKVGMISPPYSDIRIIDSAHEAKQVYTRGAHENRVGYNRNNPNQIGNLGIVSPPYHKQGEVPRPDDPFFKRSPITAKSAGNIGNARLAGLTSPPYENMINNQFDEDKKKERLERYGSLPGQIKHDPFYGETAGQIGKETNEDYSSAMLKVYSEAFKADISPLVTVTKNPTRKGKFVRLDLMTADLLVRAGYELFDYHQATLVNIQKEREITLDFSEPSERTTAKGRLGFFKRLQLLKGGIVATHEDVIFAKVPDQ